MPARSGGEESGGKAVGIRDVAAAAHVSVATVSRVLNPELEYPIKQETRARVLDAIDRLGYRPNDLARALLQRNTRTIGLVIPDIANPYYPDLVRGGEDVASARGYRVVLCNTDRSAEKTGQYLDTLVSQRVDGVVVAGGDVSAWSPDLLERYRMKVVVVGRHDVAYPSVRVDNAAAARAATEHLLDLGHRRIAFLAGPLGSNTVQDRLSGHRAALDARGLEPLVHEGTFAESSGYDAVPALLAARPRPTAIVAANDRMAFGALAALTDNGLRVPQDMSLVGFDDTTLATYTRPALTSVAIPTYAIGGTAMTALLDWRDTGTRPPDTRIDSHLVVRASSAPPG